MNPPSLHKFPLQGSGFLRYLAEQKKPTIVVAVVSILLFAALKFVFPVPDFFLDSYSYVQDAANEIVVTYRPKGYPYFLARIHDVSGASGAVVIAQYLIFLVSSFFFFFTCDYLLGVPGRYKNILLFLVIINPILLLQTNLISSDSLFSSLTVTWFSICLWCMIKPNKFALIMQVVFLFLCFQVRFTAIYYPAITLLFFAISKAERLYKLAGIFLSIGIIFASVEQQKDKMEAETGSRFLSAFSGWQIANNVLCYYKEIEVNRADLPSQESAYIDTFVKQYIGNHYIEGNNIGTYYLWGENSPLKYYHKTRMRYYGTEYFHEWCVTSEYFSEYAWWIIKKNPLAYARFFMWPNFKYNYLVPDAEVLGNYDMYGSTIPTITKEWFGFEFDRLYCRYPSLQKMIMYPYPAISCLINLVNITVIMMFLVMNIRKWRSRDRDSWRVLLAWAVFYSSYMFFSIFSTVVLLRYLDPLFTLGIVMPFVLLKRLKSGGVVNI